MRQFIEGIKAGFQNLYTFIYIILSLFGIILIYGAPLFVYLLFGLDINYLLAIVQILWCIIVMCFSLSNSESTDNELWHH